MEKQRWEQSEKRREEERRSEKKEDAGARKGRKVAIHCFSNDVWLPRSGGCGAIWPDER